MKDGNDADAGAELHQIEIAAIAVLARLGDCDRMPCRFYRRQE
jgi:hypothetical protein